MGTWHMHLMQGEPPALCTARGTSPVTRCVSRPNLQCPTTLAFPNRPTCAFRSLRLSCRLRVPLMDGSPARTGASSSAVMPSSSKRPP